MHSSLSLFALPGDTSSDYLLLRKAKLFPCWPGSEGGGRIPGNCRLDTEAVQPWTCLEQQSFILI